VSAATASLSCVAQRRLLTAEVAPLHACRYVVKRDGRQACVSFDKITARITKLSYGLNPDFCDPVGQRSDGGLRCWLGARPGAAQFKSCTCPLRPVWR
jgi:hypothetical protein